jgi:hypothetical protein
MTVYYTIEILPQIVLNQVFKGHRHTFEQSHRTVCVRRRLGISRVRTATLRSSNGPSERIDQVYGRIVNPTFSPYE